MKYIIMCGGVYTYCDARPLFKIDNETLVERTIRLLRELGVEDIAVSTNTENTFLDFLDVEKIKFDNSYVASAYNHSTGSWADAFYYTNEPCCYLMGDTWYSKDALKQIVETEAKDILFFGEYGPYEVGYYKVDGGGEPLAFKVVDQDMLHRCCARFKELDEQHAYARKPIAWELYRIIDGLNVNIHSFGPRWVPVHYFASDIDSQKDIGLITEAVHKWRDYYKKVD